MFKQLTIGKKIAGGFAAVLVLTAIIGVISSYNMSRAGTKAQDMAEQTVPQVIVAKKNGTASNHRFQKHLANGNGHVSTSKVIPLTAEELSEF